ncbi:MAG TPA: AzlC family ABC transporter permease, partial [Galbitalea sp.]
MARSNEARAAIRSSVAVAVAVSLYGVSFGALSVAAGLDIWQTCVLSLFMFSGGSQFALIGVIATGGSSAGFAAIAGAALLGTRNGLYAIRISPIVGGPLWRRLLAAQFTIDESTAVATAQPTREGQQIGFWWT